MNTAAETWEGIAVEIALELRDAVFVVVTDQDVDALEAIERRACVVGQHALGWGFAVGCLARDVVFVGAAAADPWWRAKLAADAPEIRVHALRDVESPALALGLGLPRSLTLAESDALAATWDRIVLEGARREDWKLPARRQAAPR